MKELKPSHNWLTRNIINKAFISYRKNLNDKKDSVNVPKIIDVEENSSSSACTISTVSSQGGRSGVGRPVGSTDDKKYKDEKKFINAKNEISKKYAALKETTKQGSRTKKGALKEIIESVSEIRGLDKHISPAAIRRRIDRKSLVSHHVAGGQMSPLQRMEPTVVEIILQMARICQCLTPSKGLQLINSLIKGTAIQKELIAWKIIQMEPLDEVIGASL